MMYRYDPKVKALVARDDKDIEVVEARLDEIEGKGPGKLSRSRRRPGGRLHPNNSPQGTERAMAR